MDSIILSVAHILIYRWPNCLCFILIFLHPNALYFYYGLIDLYLCLTIQILSCLVPTGKIQSGMVTFQGNNRACPHAKQRKFNLYNASFQ